MLHPNQAARHATGIALLLFGLVLPGCTYATQHGDARVIHQMPQLFARENLLLPEVTLGVAHSRTIRVRNLRKPMFPREIEIPEFEDDPFWHWTDDSRPPWASAKFTIEFYHVDGRPIYSENYDLGELKPRSSGPGNPIDKPQRRMTTSYLFPFDEWDQLVAQFWGIMDFDVVVTVHEPSERGYDWFRIHGLLIDRRVVNGEVWWQ